jgi:hypothetical protein
VTFTRRWFQEMLTGRSNPTTVASVVNHAASLPRSRRDKLLLDLLRYDVGRLATASTDLFVPVMATRTTYSNGKRERQSMSNRQTAPYLDILGTCIPSVRTEIISDTAIPPKLTRVRRRMRCSTASPPHCQSAEKRRSSQNTRIPTTRSRRAGERGCAPPRPSSRSVSQHLLRSDSIYWEKPRAIQFLRNALIGQSLASSYEVRA